MQPEYLQLILEHYTSEWVARPNLFVRAPGIVKPPEDTVKRV